ncbi:hypothetical protein QFZ50_001780 [Arthrobacter agilis]|nr:hypothetical protein [Arthrobacter agilis]
MPLNPIPHTNTCKRGCCWTPYGTCGRQRTCSHHKQEDDQRAAREARASLAREAENLANLRAGNRNGARAWTP